MEYVFAIFIFGLMISLLVLKGVVLARDLANEECKGHDSTAGTGSPERDRPVEVTR